MSWCTHLPYRSRRHATRAGRLARMQGFALQVQAGRHLHELRVATPPDACAAIRLQLSSGLGRGSLDLDLEALDPSLSAELCEQLPVRSLIDALNDNPWLDVAEGLLGTALHIESVRLRPRWRRTALTLQARRVPGARLGHLALGGEVFVQRVLARPEWQQWEADQRARTLPGCTLRAAVCLRASRLRAQQLRHVAAGALVRVIHEQPVLRLRMRRGFHDFPLLIEGKTCMIESSLPPPLPGDAADATLVPIEQLALDVDVVLASLRLDLDDLRRLRPGATLELPLPVQRTAVDLRCEGTPFARGELVRIGGRLGVLIEHVARAPAP
ncbi:MAG TPA: FliM/FliN family flagellar motor switch protein [Stenotrophomonas sp.]|nr:FliM/FliN family flagellar motor switch protein [Stenotrophomonas sp.]